jgi:light-regulated signal transduction histidine kinase (bacteriophytochrome)
MKAELKEPKVNGAPVADYYVHAMEHLISVVQELSLARNLENIMAIVRQAARRLTGADGATFILRDNGFCYYADEDAIAPLWKGKRFPMERCISGWAMLNRQPAVIRDIYDDPRIPAEAYRPTFVKSLAMVPIRSLDPVGAIGTYWATLRMPKPEEVKILQALADCTSVAMENVELYSGLEQKVAERTARLQALNEELDSFSYSVSHDLRAPLRHVGGFIELLKKQEADKLSAKGMDYLNIILASTLTMSGLINDLLEFSRMGRAEMRKFPLEMKALVNEVWLGLASERKDRDIVWDLADLPPVEGDGALLKQVWVNLLSNAIKYSKRRDRAEIRVGFTEREKEYEFYVKDNGAGFDMKYADKLFGVFQRLHHKDEFEGTGIGLANVRRIITRHGGRAWADGKIDKSATFYFTLPKKSQ